jgi:hypothetical protein
MKKILILFAFCFLSINFINAQQMQRQRIKLLKTSFITDAINLTPKEAEKFWPIYNLYTKKIQRLKITSETSFKTKARLVGGIDNITEEQAQKLIDNAIKTEQQITATKINMIRELSTVISGKKIVLLKIAERSFNRKMLQELGKRRRMQGQ